LTRLGRNTILRACDGHADALGTAASMSRAGGAAQTQNIGTFQTSIFNQERTVAMPRSVEVRRSVVKALTYRIVIMCLDFATIYLFTRKVHIALGFMVASNIYTTVGYFAHERLWARIKWGVD
jgi:uncharacterized membrane protein